MPDFLLPAIADETASAEADVLDAARWIRAFQVGVEAVVTLGGAGAGDRTMLDALLPALTVFQQALSDTDAPASADRSRKRKRDVGTALGLGPALATWNGNTVDAGSGDDWALRIRQTGSTSSSVPAWQLPTGAWRRLRWRRALAGRRTCRPAAFRASPIRAPWRRPNCCAACTARSSACQVAVNDGLPSA